jgi:hypothetical protein
MFGIDTDKMPSWWSAPTANHAYILSLISIVITLIAAVVGIIGYTQLGDSLILIYGLENVVDFFSSAIVLWRFNDSTSSNDIEQQVQEQTNNEQTQSQTQILENREKRASIGVTIVLSILGFGGIITAIDDFTRGASEVDEDDAYTVYVISFLSFIIFSILAKFKFHYATELNSPSLRKDGLCSGIGAILGFTMFVNAILMFMTTDHFWWWLDPFVALLCGIAAFGYGIFGIHKAYIKDGYPIFNIQWWLYGGPGSRASGGGNAGAGQGQHVETGLELQVENHISRDDSMAGNPSMSDPSVSGIDDMKARSDDEGMSDIVIT